MRVACDSLQAVSARSANGNKNRQRMRTARKGERRVMYTDGVAGVTRLCRQIDAAGPAKSQEDGPPVDLAGRAGERVVRA
jgi:hypothetical protein